MGLYSVPFWLLKRGTASHFRGFLDEHYFSQEEVNVAAEYYATMVQRHGRVEAVQENQGEHFGIPRHDLMAEDRMGNPAIDFPVGFVFGDRDFFGATNGADAIVAANPHFKSGRSQIFKLENSGHNVFLNNPYGLVDYMVGFLDGTITGHYELRPRTEFVPRRPWAEMNK